MSEQKPTLQDIKAFFVEQFAHGGIDVASVNATLEILWQQLAEAQDKIARQEEELRIVLAQRQDYKAHAAEAQKEALFWKGQNDSQYARLVTYMEHLTEARVLLGAALGEMEPNYSPLSAGIDAFLQKLKG